ncbi:MAG: porphobilinogen synthase [Synergistaceae bacterium]|nr:porphobilinogen synthase [Synergistaceae bacterium]
MTARFPQMRLRRLRGHERLRTMIAETSLEKRHLILPLFVVPGENVATPIPSLEGVSHFSVDCLLPFVEKALGKGIGAFILFGLPETKDPCGDSAKNSQGPVQRALRKLTKTFPEAFLLTDVCLCQYTDHGHCGLITDDGIIDNDNSLKQLAAVALSHAEAGAHMVAPSDMMDGRVQAIRETLDAGGFSSVSIMSYAAKMASAFYGPFRDAADSAPGFGDRHTYQMAPTNGREALREALADEEEGADILMVKPALTCLDILSRLREKTLLPLATYLVSGERMMLRSSAAAGHLDLRRGLLEAHLACRRAGADLIITYDALDLAEWID